jgi:hypothetical protein
VPLTDEASSAAAPPEARSIEGHGRLAAVRLPISLLALAASATLVGACVPRARMCTASSECSDKSACVAGRCQLEKTSVKPAVDSARRLVVHPVDIAYVKRGGFFGSRMEDVSSGDGGDVLPNVFVLGKDGAKLFLRFAVPILPTANIVEAYVILHRSNLVDDDPEATVLHATRIVESWSARSMTWARQPRTTETRLPSTTVEPGGAPIVRLDVRDVVRQWARRDPNDHGLAIISENETKTGMTFALGEVGAERSSFDTSFGGRPGPPMANLEPYLELYIR